MQQPTYRVQRLLKDGALRARYVMAVDLAVVEDRLLSLVHRHRAVRNPGAAFNRIPGIPRQRDA